jgi:hypothetical protein
VQRLGHDSHHGTILAQINVVTGHETLHYQVWIENPVMTVMAGRPFDGAGSSCPCNAKDSSQQERDAPIGSSLTLVFTCTQVHLLFIKHPKKQDFCVTAGTAPLCLASAPYTSIPSNGIDDTHLYWREL